MSIAFRPLIEGYHPTSTAFTPFPLTPRVPDNDLYTLIIDFFEWLETDWRLPIVTKENRLLSLPQPLALTEDLYTAHGLAQLYGHCYDHVLLLLRTHSIFPVSGGKGGKHALYRKKDLAPVIERWEWQRLLDTLDHSWLRFFPPACETCRNCQELKPYHATQQFNCSRHIPLGYLRTVFTRFLTEVRSLNSVARWWQQRTALEWKRGARPAWGILFIYLLDRRLLHLSNDELLQLEPIRNRHRQDFTRLWRNRHPDEYDQFLQAMKAANYRAVQSQEQVLIVLSLLILLKHGLHGIAELGRPLSPEEILQVCSEERLVTQHLGHGFFLSYPLTTDIRVGHVVLDDLRRYFWQYGAEHGRKTGKQQWHKGPHNWNHMTLNAIEQVLAAPKYEGAEGILSRRPETEQKLSNPLRITEIGELANNGFSTLPMTVQEHLRAFIVYCHREQRLEITTLVGRIELLMNFFAWARKQGKLANYPHWTRQYAQEIFRSYASIDRAEVQASTRRKRCIELAHFFSLLTDLEYPVPAGYRLLYTLVKDKTKHPRSVPREEIMDRVFREGVCNLNHAPFERLALTIQYYCGTRIKETLEIHLLSVLEDKRGHAYLLIPRGKSKQERLFPIVQLGMGTLFTYMEEVFKLRTAPDKKTSLTLGKTNIRYLVDDPERAMDWHYLFDRVPSSDGPVKMRGRLSPSRTRQALSEALLIAAKINPEGLFQPGTYHPRCQHRRKKGQSCTYFAAQEGITTCPCCGSPLSGERGVRCRHILEENIKCDGFAEHGEVFCPKCDMPLAKFVPISTHVFRHNSVSRAHRAGVSLAQNMKLHGHQTITMHLRYLHLFLEDAVDEIQQVFAEKRLQEVLQVLGTTSGQVVEGGIAYNVSLERYLSITLQRALRRRTIGIWGGFWAGALAQQGVASPTSTGNDIVILEDTYEHTAAQYWYEALGLAISEVAYERVTNGKWQAIVPPFLDREKIEDLVQFHLRTVQDSLQTALGMRLMETDIIEQRQLLGKLAEMLRPWWQHQDTINSLIEIFAPGGGHAFQKQLPATESES